ncbi:caspase family protein [Streptomyces somaliensis DSM 40738]|uniref:Caspase family protein n=1 Tax=Streptomyces somaliensis (strain ATCC 33201 / DSM 40738 / JCM 12659 / KCTC 9044 / NCTC 11332 / NRRL B-12077 / IP 733) TaxID=1134445 RepID=A0AA44IFE7_STRE0|nr:caspase family protein [Streptomyces somaliensis]MCQ0025040.1 caspase family protein [Streptomyces somaliensis DSM 40738]NKY16567.1 caspase family protein [Streptomyces somaliensis DSM 40738]
MGATGLSLHIGLNTVDPDRYDGWDGRLLACENDARDMAALARDSGYADTVLLTGEATVDGVTAALRDAAARLGEGDAFLLTYSGHGGQVPDETAGEEEPDALDETLVLYDRQYLDDELNRELARFADGVRILVLLDCCHSGSAVEVRDLLTPEALREQFGTADREAVEAASRLMPAARQGALYQRDKGFFDELQRELRAERRPADALLISACQDNQVAADGPVNGRFTGTLLRVWDGGAYRGDHRAFHRAIVRRMPANQSPNLYLSGRPAESFLAQRPFTV